MNMGYMRQVFVQVFLTLIFIYIIKTVSIKYDIPFMKTVVQNV